MTGIVYAKTDKGREEIAMRQAGLPARLRSLLLMIDGRRSVGALASALGPAEQTEANAALLLAAGFIEAVAEVAGAPVETAPAVAPPAVPTVAPLKVSMHDIYASRAGPRR